MHVHQGIGNSIDHTHVGLVQMNLYKYQIVAIVSYCLEIETFVSTCFGPLGFLSFKGADAI